jgi:ribose-phosphate pyrophosphokinase
MWSKKMTSRNNALKIFTGNANPALAMEICDYLNIPLARASVKKFSDGEIFVEIGENVRGSDVFIIQPTSPPVNRNLMELLIMTDALRRASARRITAVTAYYGYGRQDRKAAPRVPITAKLVADLITTAGARRVLAMDLHAGQIQGFFNIPVDHLYAAPTLYKYLKENIAEDIVMVSPDAGGVERVRYLANKLHTTIAIIDKRRERPNESKVMNVIGDVSGKTAVLLDDMIDTAGTICHAADTLMEKGAKKVYACATHAVLSGPAIDRIKDSNIEKLIVTNTIPLNENAINTGKIIVLSVSEVLGEAIRRIHEDDSITLLFE